MIAVVPWMIPVLKDRRSSRANQVSIVSAWASTGSSMPSMTMTFWSGSLGVGHRREVYRP